MSTAMPSIRVTLVRYFVLFLTALFAWTVVVFVGRGVVAFGMGCAIADILACLGVIASHYLDAAQVQRPVAMMPSEEFAAVPMPLYLVPSPSSRGSMELAPWVIADAGAMVDSGEYETLPVPVPMPVPYHAGARYAS